MIISAITIITKNKNTKNNAPPRNPPSKPHTIRRRASSHKGQRCSHRQQPSSAASFIRKNKAVKHRCTGVR